jgi:hypothetical protein
MVGLYCTIRSSYYDMFILSELKQKDFIEESSISSPSVVDTAALRLQKLRDELILAQQELEENEAEQAAVDLEIMEMNEVHDQALEEFNQIPSPIKSNAPSSNGVMKHPAESLSALKDKEST